MYLPLARRYIMYHNVKLFTNFIMSELKVKYLNLLSHQQDQRNRQETKSVK